MGQYDHIINAFAKEWNVTANIEQSHTWNALQIRVFDKATDRQFAYNIDNMMIMSGSMSTEDHIIQVCKELGRHVEANRKEMGLYPPTGKPIFEASKDRYFDIYDPKVEFTISNRKPPAVDERKKLKSYGRY